MSALSITRKLTECLLGWHHERWGEWALLGVAILSLALLIAAAKAQARSQD